MTMCIRLFKQTIPGYYENMTVVETRRKYAGPQYPNKLQKIWLKYKRIPWTGGNSISVALAFQRRDHFADGTHNPPDYYLSVGLSNEHVNSNPNTGDESDTYDADAVAVDIAYACKEFDAYLAATQQNSHLRRLHIARHMELDLSETRMGRIFAHANNNGYVDANEGGVAETLTPGGTRRLWPPLRVRKIIKYWNLP